MLCPTNCGVSKSYFILGVILLSITFFILSYSDGGRSPFLLTLRMTCVLLGSRAPPRPRLPGHLSGRVGLCRAQGQPRLWCTPFSVQPLPWRAVRETQAVLMLEGERRQKSIN